jgi:hypothetical protein
MSFRSWDLVESIAVHQHGVVSDAQLRSSGVPRSTIASWRDRGRVWTPAPGVVAIGGSVPTWRQHLMAASLSHGGDLVVVSHRAGVCLQGIDGVEGPWLEASLQRDRHAQLDGFRLHRTDTLEAADVTFVDGIRCTSVARTLCDLGAVVDDDTVAQALDDALRRGYRRRWIEQTLDRVERPGPSGTASLRRVLGRVDGSTDSWFETKVLTQLRSLPGAGPIVPQLEVRFADGRLLACLDAGLPEWKIGVESHSKRWHFGDRKNVLDADRDNELTVLGWETIYIRRKQAYTRGEVRRIVGGAIETRRRTVAPSTQPAYLATQLGVR